MLERVLEELSEGVCWRECARSQVSVYAGDSMRGAEQGCMLERACEEPSEGVCWREHARSRARVYAG